MARRSSNATSDPAAAFDAEPPSAATADANAPTTGAQQATAYVPTNVFSSEEDQTAFMSYLCGEIKDVRDGNDRKALETQWDTWRRQRMAKPEVAERDTPWIKASNVEPPLTMQKVNTVYAKLLGAYAVKKPPVSVTAVNPADRDLADSLEHFFKGMHDSRYGLDMRRKLKTIFYDVASLGTEFIKVPFRIDQWAFKRTTPAGTESVTYVQHKGPAIVPIRLEDFFTRPYWKDLQRAPWIGVRYRYFYHELLQMQAQGLLQNVDAILNESLTTYDDNTNNALDRAAIPVSNLGATDPNKEYEIYECNVFWDVDGDGVPEDVIAWVEPNTGTMLRSEFNPLSVRDIEPMGYLDDPSSLYSIGVCQMVESSQDEVTALHRMRLDGTKLAMLSMFVARRGCGIGPDETFEPMKLLLVDDPQQDFKQIEFPDIATSCITGEQMAKDYADRVTGANDYMAGFNDKTVGSGATAAGTTFLAGQANSILNSLLENTEQSMTNIYMLVLYQCIANKDNVDISFLSQADQVNVASILNLQVEDLPTKFRFTVQTTDINKTDQARQQAMLMASQLYSTYGQQAMQLLQAKMNPQLAQNPDMQELMNSLYVGSTLITSKMLEFFDVGNAEDFVPFVDHLKVQLRAMDAVRTEQVAVMKEQLNGTGASAATAAGQSGQVGEQMGAAGAAAGGLGAAGTGAASTVQPAGQVAPTGAAGQSGTM